MYEFSCASPVCKTHLTAPTTDELLPAVLKHFAVKHKVPDPSRSIVEFVVANTVREVPA